MTHIPPEQWKDFKTPRSAATDAYAFGIMLWELLTEQLAFQQGSSIFIWPIANYEFRMLYMQRISKVNSFK